MPSSTARRAFASFCAVELLRVCVDLGDVEL
jgi:hypothetical protein